MCSGGSTYGSVDDSVAVSQQVPLVGQRAWSCSVVLGLLVLDVETVEEQTPDLAPEGGGKPARGQKDLWRRGPDGEMNRMRKNEFRRRYLAKSCDVRERRLKGFVDLSFNIVSSPGWLAGLLRTAWKLLVPVIIA